MTYRVGVRDYVLAMRWVPWHVVCYIVVAVLVWLGFWQWGVAGGPHPAGASIAVWRNYAYAVNWWIFAAVALWFWWRFMRDQKVVDEKREAEWLAEQEAAALAVEGEVAQPPDQEDG